MNTAAFAFVAAALLVVTIADHQDDPEDKRTRVLKFYECITCAKDPAALEEYLTCAVLKPEKVKETGRKCREQVFSESSKIEDVFHDLCESENLRAKIYDCIMNDESRKTLDDDEKMQLKEFIKCMKKVNKKFCLADENS